MTRAFGFRVDGCGLEIMYLPRRAALAALAFVAFSTVFSRVSGGEALDPSGLACREASAESELRRLCDGLVEGVRTALEPSASTWSVSRSLKARPSLARRMVSPEFTARGVSRKVDPLAPAWVADRAVGVRLRAGDTPLQFSTEVVQPGDPAAEAHLSWQVKAERGLAPGTSGLFWGGAASGVSSTPGLWDDLSGFAGIRSVMQPLDHLQLGAEIAPRINLVDIGTLSGSAALEPRLTTQTALGEIFDTGYEAKLNMDMGYHMPLDGPESSGYGRVRLTIRGLSEYH
jgi:hypothetical protein